MLSQEDAWCAVMRMLPWLVVVSACQMQHRLPDPDWVADAARVLSAQEESQLMALLLTLNAETAVELACVTVHGTGEQSITAYAHELLWRWQVGLSGVFNGIVIVVDTKERQVQIARGDGMRWTLTNQDVDEILAIMTSHFKEDFYFSGLQAGIEAVAGKTAGVPWDVAYFDLASLPLEGGEGEVVAFTAAVEGVRGDTVLVLDEDSIHAKVILLPDTTPLIMEDIWLVHARIQHRDPLELLLLGLERGELSEEMNWE